MSVLPTEVIGPLVTNAPTAGPARWRRVVGMGDSVVAGIGDPVPGYPDRSWFDQVVERLGPQTTAINLGVVGMLAPDIRATQLEQALALQPDLVMLSAGGNDMFRTAFDPLALAEALDEVVAALRAGGADVVTFGFFDLGDVDTLPAPFRERLAVHNPLLAAMLATSARRHGSIHIDNSHRRIDPALMSADGIHFNRRGHAMLAALVADVLGLGGSRR